MGDKTSKRELILTAAREVFFEKGYHDATSEEIAKRAGVGKGTLYQYFESKQEIFLEMHRLYIEQYGDQIGACIDEASSFEENLRRIVHFHMENIHNMVQYSVRILADMAYTFAKKDHNMEIAREARNKVETVLRQLILTGQERGDIRVIDTQLILYFIAGIFMGMAHLVVSKNLSESQKSQMEEEIVQSILHGIAF